MSTNSSLLTFRHTLLKFSLCAIAFVTFNVAGLKAQDSVAATADTVAASASADVSAGAAIAGDPAVGQKLFEANCKSCHAIGRKLTGPALKGVLDRHDRDWLHTWIKDSQAMIASGDPTAVALFAEYNNSIMTPFPALSEGDIDNILAFVQSETKALTAAAATAPVAAPAEDEGISASAIVGLIALGLVLFLVIMVLNRTIGSLERVILKNNGEEIPEPVAAEPKDRFAYFKKLAKNKKFIALSIVGLIVISSAWSWQVMWNVGVEQYYQPKQPIRFSHKLHAGVNQIDCQYCHGGAWKSKNATIPSLNICMNCHNVVDGTGSESKTAKTEIAKIYTALDFDPASGEYGDNPKPIEWIRVHKLPDFAYFNHSQHVNVGAESIKLAKGLKAEDPVCYACHGPVAEMEEIYQYSPLTMKWCINCHRETEMVHAKDNAYYDKVLAAHEQMKKGEKVTVAALGGIECAKCHY